MLRRQRAASLPIRRSSSTLHSWATAAQHRRRRLLQPMAPRPWARQSGYTSKQHSAYIHYIIYKRPARVKASYQNAFALAGRFRFCSNVKYTQHFHKKLIAGYDQASVEYFPTCSPLFPTFTLLYFCDIFLTLLIFNDLSFCALFWHARCIILIERRNEPNCSGRVH